MKSIIGISEAAVLAIHAIVVLVRQQDNVPVKIGHMAKMLGVSENHLGKVMHRLTQKGFVASKRGPTGGALLGETAKKGTFLDVYELFDGPLKTTTCLFGYDACSVGGCILGDTIAQTNKAVRTALDKQICSFR